MRSLSLVLSSSMARLARRRSAQRTLGIRMRSSAAEDREDRHHTTTQSGKLTCEPMQNPDPASPATPRAAAPRPHDTVWNSIVTSVAMFATAISTTFIRTRYALINRD
jgi:hypothetical protein